MFPASSLGVGMNFAAGRRMRTVDPRMESVSCRMRSAFSKPEGLRIATAIRLLMVSIKRQHRQAPVHCR